MYFAASKGSYVVALTGADRPDQLVGVPSTATDNWNNAGIHDASGATITGPMGFGAADTVVANSLDFDNDGATENWGVVVDQHPSGGVDGWSCVEISSTVFRAYCNGEQADSVASTGDTFVFSNNVDCTYAISNVNGNVVSNNVQCSNTPGGIPLA